VSIGSGVGVRAQPSPVDRLVAEGLRSNLAVRQEALSLEQSRRALAEARGRYLPSLDVQARYSRAEGGRTIDIPVGDLVNPVYRTLNELLAEQGRPGEFPTVENQEVRFLREREQETALRLTQPLFAPRIRYGVRAQRHDVASREAALEAFQRDLVRDIQVAYYRFQKARRKVAILEAAEALARENKRTNERLLAADAVTREAVFRADADVLALQQQVEAARGQRDQARSYLNFLLNRPLDTPIAEPEQDLSVLVARRTDALRAALPAASADTSFADAALSTWTNRARQQRPVLDQLASAISGAEAQTRLTRTAYLPSVSLVVEAGTQGEVYGFGDDQRFLLGSVVLRWNLFDGGQDRARVQQQRLATERLRLQREEAARQIDLQVQDALDDVQVALRSLTTAEARVRAARESFRLTRRRYEEGRANLVTFTDARTTLTDAELNLSVTRFDVLTRLAELERAAALYPLPDVPPAID
jgi:outer membrane protein TolC